MCVHADLCKQLDGIPAIASATRLRLADLFPLSVTMPTIVKRNQISRCAVINKRASTQNGKRKRIEENRVDISPDMARALVLFNKVNLSIMFRPWGIAKRLSAS